MGDLLWVQTLMLVNETKKEKKKKKIATNATFLKVKQHCPKQRRSPAAQTGVFFCFCFFVFNTDSWYCYSYQKRKKHHSWIGETWCISCTASANFVLESYHWGHSSVKKEQNKANFKSHRVGKWNFLKRGGGGIKRPCGRQILATSQTKIWFSARVLRANEEARTVWFYRFL